MTRMEGKKNPVSKFSVNFSTGKEVPNEDTASYPNPGAVLTVFKPAESPVTAYAFGAKMANLPVAKKPVAGYTYQLIDFEKAPDRHILAVQRDPGTNVVYVGFVMLFITLVAVFFFSHQRIWASIERSDDDKFSVTLGGHVNRNQNAFDEKFKTLVESLQAERPEEGKTR